MKAIVFDGSIRLEKHYPPPKREHGEALISPILGGICNTDIELSKGYMGYTGVLGHEFVGVVTAADNQTLVGKRVVGEINCPCGKCRMCREGLGNHCPTRTVLGIQKRNGAFSEFFTLPEKNLHLVPDSVPDEHAVFVEPLAAAFQIARQLDVSPLHKVAVLGDGKLGLLIAKALRLTKCDLLAVGKHQNRLDILSKDSIATELAAKMKDRSMEFDMVVDATGSPSGLDLAARLVKPHGVIVLKTTIASKSDFDLNRLVINEIAVVGSRCGPFNVALAALEKKEVDVAPLISATIPLDDGEEAMRMAINRRDMIKILVSISERS